MTAQAPKLKPYRGRPLLTYHRGVYVCFVETRDSVVPRNARFDWSQERRYWYTRDAARALSLSNYADEIAKMALDGIKSDARAALLASRATDSDIEIPVPEGLAYLPFQRAGIAYALMRPNVLIGDEMGLGKTIQACGIINADASIAKVLVVCPASLKINWLRELTKWLVRPLTVIIAGEWFPASADVVIVNYEQLRRHRAALDRTTFDILIVDEAHKIKNPEAERSRHVYAIKARRRAFLTGTPIVNRPMEFYPLAHALAPETFDDENAYRNRYASADVRSQAGNQAMRELQTKARMSFMVRRLKMDVLTDLPAKRRQIIELPAGSAAKVVEAEANAIAQSAAKLEAFRVALELAKVADDPGEYPIALEAFRKAASEHQGATAKVRHATALAKVPAVVDHITRALEEVAQCVLFAHHHDVIDAYVAQLPAAVKLDGTMKLDERQRSVDAFQAGKARVFVGSILAAGVGITLTSASNVFFAELDWVPGNMTQAEDRCHRIGQKDSVNVTHLVLEGSSDADVARELVEKQIVIDAALDSKLDGAGPLADPIVPGITETFATAHVTRERLQRDVDAGLPPVDMDALPNTAHRIDVALMVALRELEQTPLRLAMAARIVRKYQPQEAKA